MDVLREREGERERERFHSQKLELKMTKKQRGEGQRVGTQRQDGRRQTRETGSFPTDATFAFWMLVLFFQFLKFLHCIKLHKTRTSLTTTPHCFVSVLPKTTTDLRLIVTRARRGPRTTAAHTCTSAVLHYYKNVFIRQLMFL